MGRARSTSTVLAVASLLTVVAACGARLDDEQLASVTGPQAGAPGQATATGARPAGGSATTAPAAAGGAAPVPGGPAPEGGDGGGPAPADPGAPAPAASTCAPEGASDVGIDPDSVTLGQIGTISGPVPGLGQTAMNGAKAYAAYRNSQGGVCGRELRIVNGDDRLDTGQNRAEHARLSESVLGFVGGWSVVDDGGASVLEGTNIPDVTISITEQRAALPNNFSTSPIDPNGSGNLTILQYLLATYRPTSAAVVWGAQATSRARAQGFVADLQRLGLDVSVQREVAITETNYVPVAQEIENAGAQLVVTTLEIGMIARLAQAFRQIGYQPPVPYYGAQTYGEQFVSQAGPAADGAIIGLTHPIAEEAAATGGIAATFVEWYQRVNPGQPIDFFAYQGWVAADMMADAVEAAGPAPTRDAVLAALATFTTFDADGLVAPFNPAGKQNSPCFMIVTVDGGEWRRVYPEGSGFACP